MNCLQCYNGNFLVNCRSTRDSEFCFDLQNCENCFLSGNLRHKSYVFQNQQFSKEEYFLEVLEYKKTHSAEQTQGDFSRLMLSAARPNMFLLNTENCTGDQIVNSKNVFYGFDAINAEDFFYCEESGYGRDCCDCLVTSGELNYECFGVSKNAYNNSFCIACTICVNCEFCMTCYNLSDCFACFYLKGKQFYILNVAHSANDYKREVTQLKKELYNAGLYRLDFLKTPPASS